jgi:hypothetical protein
MRCRPFLEPPGDFWCFQQPAEDSERRLDVTRFDFLPRNHDYQRIYILAEQDCVTV